MLAILTYSNTLFLLFSYSTAHCHCKNFHWATHASNWPLHLTLSPTAGTWTLARAIWSTRMNCTAAALASRAPSPSWPTTTAALPSLPPPPPSIRPPPFTRLHLHPSRTPLTPLPFLRLRNPAPPHPLHFQPMKPPPFTRLHLHPSLTPLIPLPFLRLRNPAPPHLSHFQPTKPSQQIPPSGRHYKWSWPTTSKTPSNGSLPPPTPPSPS